MAAFALPVAPAGSTTDLFLQAEGGIRDLVRSRGLGDGYKRQKVKSFLLPMQNTILISMTLWSQLEFCLMKEKGACLLYTSDAADELLCVDPGGRRITQKNTTRLRRSITTRSRTQ